MTSGVSLIFGPFRLDPVMKRLWHEDTATTLRPTAVTVLQTLAEHPERVFSKEELLKKVWAGTYVTKSVLKVCIREIRQALGDDSSTPKYIETVGRQGYRFLRQPGMRRLGPMGSEESTASDFVVGRADEVALLRRWWASAEQGVRQVGFVTGEPGIGKTTVLELFLRTIPQNLTVRIGRGQCSEQFGEGEPYLPVLEALARLCQEAGGSQIIEQLRKYAPTWLMQMPAVVRDEELVMLQHKVQGVTRQRMLREIAETLVVVTQEQPLILILEDLHWSDHSTIELLNYLAQRQERARLLVIGTYRPENLTAGHQLRKVKHDLQVRGSWRELPLPLLTLRDVSVYLTGRFSPRDTLNELASAVHQKTGGNALFMVNLVNALISQGFTPEWTADTQECVSFRELPIPDTLRQIIEHRLDRLDEGERQVLEAASVAGAEFTATAVAAALQKDPLWVEDLCTELARRNQFVQTAGENEWPDGTTTACYRFIHALYKEVLYNRLTPGKRIHYHRYIGERLEQGYGERRHAIAAELAIHFEHGKEPQRAIQYLQYAAANANHRCAYREAIAQLTKALALLETFPPPPSARRQQELSLRIALGLSLMGSKGYAAPEVKTAFDRARTLALQVDETPQLGAVLRGLVTFYYVRAELHTALELAEQIVILVHEQKDSLLFVEACQEMGGALFHRGEFNRALDQFQHGILAYDPHKHNSYAALSGQDPGVSCLVRACNTLWFLGSPEQACTKNQEALSLARSLSHPHSLAYALSFAAGFQQLRRDALAVQEYAKEAIQLATTQGFPVWTAMGMMLCGWARAQQSHGAEGIEQLQEGLGLWRTIGAQISVPYFLGLLAEAHSFASQPEKGLPLIDEALALAHNTSDRWWEAELYRLQGELLLNQHTLRSRGKKKSQFTPDVEVCFRQALAVARGQGAKALELRAAVSLSQLLLAKGQADVARHLVTGIYREFTEGFETADLCAAKALIDILGKDQPGTPVAIQPY